MGLLRGLLSSNPASVKKSDNSSRAAPILWNVFHHVQGCWNISPGVTKHKGKKISNVKNPHTIKGLERGTTYFFVVTAVNELVENQVSEEISYTVPE